MKKIWLKILAFFGIMPIRLCILYIEEKQKKIDDLHADLRAIAKNPASAEALEVIVRYKLMIGLEQQIYSGSYNEKPFRGFLSEIEKAITEG